MSKTVIIDASPTLTFFGAGYEQLLFDTLAVICGELHMPTVVRGEVRNRSKKDARFRGVDQRVERSLAARNLKLLDDSQDDSGDLAARAALFQTKLAVLAGRGDQPLTRKDLGEAMVMAHAAMLRESGTPTFVLIDEANGQEVAQKAKLQIITTETVLIKAAKVGLVADVAAMKVIWDKLEPLDDRLRPWAEMTRLRNSSIYGTESHLRVVDEESVGDDAVPTTAERS